MNPEKLDTKVEELLQGLRWYRHHLDQVIADLEGIDDLTARVDGLKRPALVNGNGNGHATPQAKRTLVRGTGSVTISMLYAKQPVTREQLVPIVCAALPNAKPHSVATTIGNYIKEGTVKQDRNGLLTTKSPVRKPKGKKKGSTQ